MSDNLIPLGSNPERDKEIRRMGQKAQAEKKRQRKSLKEALLIMLSTSRDGQDATIQDNWVDALATKLENGDIPTSIFVRDSIGEKPVEKVENKITSENKEALDDYLKEVKNGKSKNT